MNKKEPREIKDRLQASGIPWRNVVIGVIVAFCCCVCLFFVSCRCFLYVVEAI